MKTLRSLLLTAVALFSSTACYHATIDTGRPASATVVDQAWASSFVYGLVPPQTVETAARCANGVARVETQLSFLNQVAGIVTFGIYTPMTVKVTCAAGATNAAVQAPAGASTEQRAAAITRAADLAAERGESVDVQL